MDRDARAHAVGQRDPPQAVLAPDHQVGGDVGVAGDRADLCAGARIERAQQVHRGLDFAPGRACSSLARPATPIFGSRSSGPLASWWASALPGCLAGELRQLQAQAFAQAARADADRVELLHLVQHGGDLVLAGLDVGRQRGGDRRQRLAQVAVVVDGLDQGHADQAVARRQRAQVQLPQQVVVQRVRFGDLLGDRGVVVAVGRADALVPGLAVVAAPFGFGRQVLGVCLRATANRSRRCHW